MVGCSFLEVHSRAVFLRHVNRGPGREMTTIVRLMVVAAVVAVAPSLGVVADPPTASRTRQLQFELADGTTMTPFDPCEKLL